MKHLSIILVLAFLLLIFPGSFKAQSSAKSKKKKTQVVKKQSEEVQVKKIVTQVIDGFFVKRDFLPTFQKFFSFAPCDKIDKEILDQNCGFEKLYSVKLTSKLGLKTMSVGMKHQFLPFYLILGTIPIKKDSDESYQYYSSDFEEIESKILKKNDSQIHDIDYENLSPRQLEQKIAEIEKVNDELENIIFNQNDSTIYKRNLEIMKDSIVIEKKTEQNRKYYNVYMEGLVYFFILTKRNGEFKVVGIDNPI